jgi:hypothetical protein
VVERHPVATAAALATVVAIGHAVWIWHVRRLGAFDADEVAYLTNAVRYRNALAGPGPGELLHDLRTTSTGPLVPLLSAVLLVVGPTDARTALLVQPPLLVAAVAAITALAGRLVAPRTAVLAGCAFAVLPTTVLAAEAYWYGLAVTAFALGALWALFASDRGAGGRVWAFGVLLGAMALSRTMAIALVPALVAAGAVLAGRDVRRLTRIGLATALGAAMAAPWYVVNRRSVFGYLWDYGYGQRASAYGTGDLLPRLVLVPLGSVLNAGVLLPVAALGGAAFAVAGHARRARAGAPHLATARWAAAHREWLALFAFVALGYAALASTANQGGWFDLPLIAVGVVLGADLLARAPRRYVRPVSVLAAAAGAIFLLSGWRVIPYGAVIPMPNSFEPPLGAHDARLLPEHRAQQAEAAADWARANARVAALLRRYGDHDTASFTMAGNMQPLNSGSVALAAQLAGWDPVIWVPDTQAPPDRRARDLTPLAPDVERGTDGIERIVVVVHHDGDVEPADRDLAGFLAQAHDLGWARVATVDLPAGSSLEVLRHRAPR